MRGNTRPNSSPRKNKRLPHANAEQVALLRLIAEIVADETGAGRVKRVMPKTRASQVPGWDSLIHGRIMLALEERLGVRVDIAHTYALRDLGGLADYLRALGGRADA